MDGFEEVYGKYMKTVYNFIMKLSDDSHVAEEITQQTFVIALEKLDDFRGECKMSVWLCQIAKHEYFAWEKKMKRRRAHNASQGAGLKHQEEKERDGLVNAIIDREDYERIMAVWHQLTEPYKEVFMLHTMAEMPYEDIGRLFQKSANWSRVVYYRAKKMIIEKLGGV